MHTPDAKRALCALRRVVRSLESKGDLSVFDPLRLSPHMSPSDESKSTRQRWRAHARLSRAQHAVRAAGLDADAHTRRFRDTI